MLDYIKFWIAKELAGLGFVLFIIVSALVLWFVAYQCCRAYDAVSNWMRRRARAKLLGKSTWKDETYR